MVLLGHNLLCCFVLIVLAMHLTVDGRAIREGCEVENGGLSSEAVKVEKVEGFSPLGSARASLKGDFVGWEMRWVPSGPDPLHHNASPKKPKTP